MLHVSEAPHLPWLYLNWFCPPVEAERFYHQEKWSTGRASQQAAFATPRLLLQWSLKCLLTGLHEMTTKNSEALNSDTGNLCSSSHYNCRHLASMLGKFYSSRTLCFAESTNSNQGINGSTNALICFLKCSLKLMCFKKMIPTSCNHSYGLEASQIFGHEIKLVSIMLCHLKKAQ